jgi:hypothetical protein
MTIGATTETISERKLRSGRRRARKMDRIELIVQIANAGA